MQTNCLRTLHAGDLDVARSIGIPEVYLSSPPSFADPMVQAFVRPLLERAGLVMAIHEAWAMIAALALIGVPLMIVAGLRRASNFTADAEPRNRIGAPEWHRSPYP